MRRQFCAFANREGAVKQSDKGEAHRDRPPAGETGRAGASGACTGSSIVDSPSLRIAVERSTMREMLAHGAFSSFGSSGRHAERDSEPTKRVHQSDRMH
jgi:hypothetical protein